MIAVLFAAMAAFSPETRSGESRASRILKDLRGKIAFQVVQYDSTRIKKRSTIPVIDQIGTLQTDGSTWSCNISERPMGKDGSVLLEATFRLEKGSLQSAGAAIICEFSGWSRDNYVMIPAIVYNGNRFRSLPGGYMPAYPAEMYYNRNSPITFSNNPRLALNDGEQSRIDLSTSSASTPALTFFSPSRKRGFILLTEQRTALGNSGMIVEESQDRKSATFSITAPAVRDSIPGFGGFFKSGDLAPEWRAGDEVTLRILVLSFPANGIPAFLDRFMSVRKALTGENHPRSLTPMSAVFDFTKVQTDQYRWQDYYSIYSAEHLWDGWGHTKVVQIGWVGG